MVEVTPEQITQLAKDITYDQLVDLSWDYPDLCKEISAEKLRLANIPLSSDELLYAKENDYPTYKAEMIRRGKIMAIGETIKFKENKDEKIEVEYYSDMLNEDGLKILKEDNITLYYKIIQYRFLQIAKMCEK